MPGLKRDTARRRPPGGAIESESVTVTEVAGTLMMGIVLSVPGSAVRSLMASAFNWPESCMLLEHGVDRGDVGGALREDRAVLVGTAGLVELGDDVELAVRRAASPRLIAVSMSMASTCPASSAV